MAFLFNYVPETVFDSTRRMYSVDVDRDTRVRYRRDWQQQSRNKTNVPYILSLFFIHDTNEISRSDRLFMCCPLSIYHASCNRRGQSGINEQEQAALAWNRLKRRFVTVIYHKVKKTVDGGALYTFFFDHTFSSLFCSSCFVRVVGKDKRSNV